MTSRRSFLRLLGLSPIAAPMAVAAVKADMGAAVGRMSVGTITATLSLDSGQFVDAIGSIHRELDELSVARGIAATANLTDAGRAALRARDLASIGFSDFARPAGGEALPANDLNEPTFLDLYTDEAA